MGNVCCAESADAANEPTAEEILQLQLHTVLEDQRRLEQQHRVDQEELHRTRVALEFAVGRVGEYEEAMLEHGLEKLWRSLDGSVYSALPSQSCRSSQHRAWDNALATMANSVRTSDAVLKQHFEIMWRHQCGDLVPK